MSVLADKHLQRQIENDVRTLHKIQGDSKVTKKDCRRDVFYLVYTQIQRAPVDLCMINTRTL